MSKICHFLCRFVPWVKPILTMSQLSFSMNVLVSHIEVNEKRFFLGFFSTNLVKFCPKSDHTIFGLSRTEMTEQIFDIHFHC